MECAGSSKTSPGDLFLPIIFGVCVKDVLFLPPRCLSSPPPSSLAPQAGKTHHLRTPGSYNSGEGLFYFLGAVLLKTEEKDVHFKYIEAAKVGNLQEVERVTLRRRALQLEVRGRLFLKEACPTNGRSSTCARPL